MTEKITSPGWYFALSEYYRRRFNCRVYKVGVAVAHTCPNREGYKGMSVCTFCDQWGSAAYHETVALPLRDQIRINRARVEARYGAEKILVYFQAYTNTFDRAERLRELCLEALEEPDVAGLVIGTRPDCIPAKMLKTLAGVARTRYLSIELGVQTLDDGQLNFLSRGHDAACSLDALKRLRQFPEIDGCVHLMFGIPGETDDQLRETAARLSALGVWGVKLHNLHVLRNTPLQKQFEEGTFQPISLPEYARRVGLFLEHLSPEIAIHRLNAVASRWDEVIAPDWVRKKMAPTQFIRDYLTRIDTWQGKYYRREGFAPNLPPAGVLGAGGEFRKGWCG